MAVLSLHLSLVLFLAIATNCNPLNSWTQGQPNFPFGFPGGGLVVGSPDDSNVIYLLDMDVDVKGEYRIIWKLNLNKQPLYFQENGSLSFNYSYFSTSASIQINSTMYFLTTSVVGSDNIYYLNSFNMTDLSQDYSIIPSIYSENNYPCLTSDGKSKLFLFTSNYNSNQSASGHFFYYDLKNETNDWIKGPSTKYNHYGATCQYSSINDTIGIFGGELETSIEYMKYEDIINGKQLWTVSTAQFPKNLYLSNSIVYKNGVYIVGGSSIEIDYSLKRPVYNANTYFYDFASDELIDTNVSLKYGECGAGLTFVNNSIFLFGGVQYGDLNMWFYSNSLS